MSTLLSIKCTSAYFYTTENSLLKLKKSREFFIYMDHFKKGKKIATILRRLSM